MVFKWLSLEIPKRRLGEDGSHRNKFYQSQENRHLVSQGTFLWPFCALTQCRAPLAFNLPIPAPRLWQEAPWLYAEVLGLADAGISSPKAPDLSEFISTARMLALLPVFVGCSCCSFDLERSVFWKIARHALSGELRLWFHAGWYRCLGGEFRCKCDKTCINRKDRNSGFKAQSSVQVDAPAQQHGRFWKKKQQ